MPESLIVQKSWAELTTDELYDFLKLRTDVFFVEQRIDEEELDNRDQEPTTQHLWIGDERGTAAYLRIIHDDEPQHLEASTTFGRVAVRADRRGEGLAQLLIERVLEQVGDRPLYLHAQAYVAPLYAKYGFVAYGEEYIEAALPHINMYRS
jgi:ElaA protein